MAGHARPARLLWLACADAHGGAIHQMTVTRPLGAGNAEAQLLAERDNLVRTADHGRVVSRADHGLALHVRGVR